MRSACAVLFVLLNHLESHMKQFCRGAVCLISGNMRPIDSHGFEDVMHLSLLQNRDALGRAIEPCFFPSLPGSFGIFWFEWLLFSFMGFLVMFHLVSGPAR